jgi:TonB family protein
MTETDKESVVPAEQAEAERYRLLSPAYDRFEKRHFLGLAASIALHLAILMGVRWALSPLPPRPQVVEVDLLPLEPVKTSPRYQVAKSKPLAREERVRQKTRPSKPPKLKPIDPDQEMTMEVVRAAPASQRKRAGRAGKAVPAVALPDTSSSRLKSIQAIPGQAALASSYQKADQRESLRPSLASTAQQASSRFQSKPETGVEKEQGPVLIASNAPASQALAPDHRHSSKRKKDFSSKGGSRQTAMGGGTRSESAQPYSLQSSSSGASTLAAARTKNGARTSAPSATSSARTAGLAPSEVSAAEGQIQPTAGASLSPDLVQANGAATDKAALASPASSQSSASGSPTEIQSYGGQQASAAGSTVSPGQTRVAGSGAGSVVSMNSSGGSGKGMPGEEGGSSVLQGSSRGGGGSISARGAGAGDFSRPGSGSASSVETAASAGGQLVASTSAANSIGPAIQSMSAVIVPERGMAKVSRVSDNASTASLQRVQPQAIAHQVENERYEAKSLKVHSPKTFCELPLMLAGFDRKPLPEGLATIMGSESAMVMEAPPELLPGNLQPTYPAAALVGNHRGVVTIRAQVLTNGQVGEMFVRPPRVAPVLEQAAMDTIRRWRFKPARRNGEPVSAWVNIPIEYRNPT